MALARSEERRLLAGADAVATITVDYEPGEPMTRDRVLAWSERFDQRDRATIVHELASVLEQTYISRATMRNLVRRLLRRRLLTTSSPERDLEQIRFLDRQRQGVSQRHLLDVLDEVLDERGLTRRTNADEASTYVYLDDGVHTGNAILFDLTQGKSRDTPAWIDEHAPNGCKLVICILALHARGWTGYAKKHIVRAAAAKRIDVQVTCHMEIPNEDLYAPNSTENPGPHTAEYLAWLEERRASKSLSPRGYLRHGQSNGRCETTEGRRVLERQFLELGAELRRTSSKTDLRPLGYDKLHTLGFGSPLVTYRNIPNTAPLALWYGPGSLFPRA